MASAVRQTRSTPGGKETLRRPAFGTSNQPDRSISPQIAGELTARKTRELSQSPPDRNTQRPTSATQRPTSALSRAGAEATFQNRSGRKTSPASPSMPLPKPAAKPAAREKAATVPASFALDEEAQAVCTMLFHQLDLDHDEQLTPEELEVARNVMLNRQAGNSTMNPHAGEMQDHVGMLLEGIDADRDGHVSREEWDCFMCSLYEVIGHREFLRMSGGWAAGLHEKLKLARSVGPAVSTSRSDKKQKTLQNGSEAVTAAVNLGNDIIMGRYEMDLSRKPRQQLKMSTTFAGKDLKKQTPVWIKTFQTGRVGSKQEDFALLSFRKQVSFLQKLQEPFVSSGQDNFFDPRLARSNPADLFIQLLDFSKDWKGQPGADAMDGCLYIVTEAPKYTLQDYIFDLRRRRRHTSGEAHLSQDAVKVFVQSMLLVIAGLHSKGLVHLNLQAESFVVLHGNLKLVDTEGCAAIDENLSITDSTLSFSPCYASPEWARFMTDDDMASLSASAVMDVWSLGIIICELVELEPITRPMYNNFARNGVSTEEAAMMFMEWLGCLKSMPLPKIIGQFDSELEQFLTSSMLVLVAEERKSLHECLKHNYVSGDWPEVDLKKLMPPEVYTDDRGRILDTTKQTLHQGTLWKLNGRGDPTNSAHWLVRDMWVASNGSLCYFSQKEGKRLVLLDASVLSRAVLLPYGGGVYAHAFQISIKSETEDAGDDVHVFGCSTDKECKDWTVVLLNVINLPPTSSVNCALVKDLRKELKVRNNRSPVETKDKFEPLLSDQLWKLKTDGDRSDDMDWFKRDMWLSQNGSLVYWSQKEGRQLIYHTSSEIARASVLKADYKDVAKRYAFTIRLPITEDVHVAPSLFAAGSASKREQWMTAFSNFAFFSETTVTPTRVGCRDRFVGLAKAKPKSRP